MIYARPFFDLQLAFAERMSSLSGVALERALLDYTNFYIRFGFGREFDSTHSGWREYADGLPGADDPSEWTYRFYTTRSRPVAPPGLVATVGCFAYARLDGHRIRIHFHAEGDTRAPLDRERCDQRKSELATLFADVKRTEHEDVRVIGASWLYNVHAYRRLFPPAYLATARPYRGRFRHMPLWGQFVNRHGAVRDDVAREFRARLQSLSKVEAADECFPSPLLSLDAPAREFYTFYGV